MHQVEITGLQYLASLNINNFLLKFTYILIFVFISFNVKAQSKSECLGDWSGVLTQGTGGYKSSYKVRLTLNQSKNDLTGFFYVDEKGLTSKMQVKGEWLSATKLKIQDVKILEHQEPDNVDWCFKTYLLEFRNSKGKISLEGTWSGKSKKDECIPGKVLLKRPSPRA